MQREKFLFAIFAHPDDESFGPSGTLYLRAQEGWQVHIICVTNGAASVEGVAASQRTDEFKEACRRIGATAHQLNFEDGCLCNKLYDNVEQAIKDSILKTLSSKKATVDFVTFEPRGVTGHVDHIVVSYITTHIFTNWQIWATEQSKRGQLHYFCLCDTQKAEEASYFVYSPRGYKEEEVDETVFVADILEQKKHIIKAHCSQRDHKAALARGDHLLSNEHFLLYKN